LSKNGEEFLGHWFADDLVEHLAKTHADGLLAQTGFV